MAERSARARNLAHELHTRGGPSGWHGRLRLRAGALPRRLWWSFDVTLDAEAPIDAVVPVHLTGVSPDGTTLLGHVCPQGEHAL